MTTVPPRLHSLCPAQYPDRERMMPTGGHAGPAGTVQRSAGWTGPGTVPRVTHHVAHASIVYWRRGIWNGRRCVPVLMTLDQGWLAMR